MKLYKIGIYICSFIKQIIFYTTHPLCIANGYSLLTSTYGFLLARLPLIFSSQYRKKTNFCKLFTYTSLYLTNTYYMMSFCKIMNYVRKG